MLVCPSELSGKRGLLVGTPAAASPNASTSPRGERRAPSVGPGSPAGGRSREPRSEPARSEWGRVAARRVRSPKAEPAQVPCRWSALARRGWCPSAPALSAAAWCPAPPPAAVAAASLPDRRAALCARRPCRSTRRTAGRPQSRRARRSRRRAPRLQPLRAGRAAAGGRPPRAGGRSGLGHPCPEAPNRRRAAAAGRRGAARLPRVAVAVRLPSAGWSLVQARAIRSVGRCSASLSSVTRTGVSAAATHVPAIHNCEVTAAAEADATLAIVSVRVLRRRSSSRSGERVAGGMRTRQGSDVGSAGARLADT